MNEQQLSQQIAEINTRLVANRVATAALYAMVGKLTSNGATYLTGIQDTILNNVEKWDFPESLRDAYKDEISQMFKLALEATPPVA